MILLTATAGGASGAYRDTGPITTIQLILIAAFAALVVAGMLWGMRQKRRRSVAEAEEEERVETMLAHPPTQDRGQPPADDRGQMRSQTQGQGAGAPATAPAPPPLGDMGLGQPEPPRAPPAPVAAEAAGGGYRLCDIKGLGPKAEPLLAAQGVTSVAELAALTPERAVEVDAALGALSGRLARDRWVEQAQLLAAGDRAGFEATFGKL